MTTEQIVPQGLAPEAQPPSVPQDVPPLDVLPTSLPVPEGTGAAPAPPIPEAAQPAVVRPQVDDAQMLREQNQQLKYQNTYYQNQQQASQLQNATLARRDQLVNEGKLPDEAAQQASSEAQSHMTVMQTQQDAQNYASYVGAKLDAAIEISEKFGTPVKFMMRHESRAAMESAGQQAQKMANLEAQLAAIQRTGVPPQTFDNGQSTMSGMNPMDVIKASNRGVAGVTTKMVQEALDKLTG